MNRYAIAALVLLVPALAFPAGAIAQSGPDGFPNKAVRIIVPYGPGGAADLLARTVGERLGVYWSQPVLVENRPGASGAIGIEGLVKSAPDGYTLGVIPVANLAVAPHLNSKLRFDVFRDLSPISLIAQVQNALVVSQASGISSIRDLVNRAKAKPGGLSYASAGVGSQAHIAGAMFDSLAGISTIHVPYGGYGAAIKDVMGGQVTLMFAQLPAVMPLVGTDKIRVLAIANNKRSSFLPNVPTVREESGIDGLEAVSWSALMGPANVPEGLRNFIAEGVARALKVPEVLARLEKQGAEPIGSTPAELARTMRIEYDRYGKVIRDAKITVD